MRLHKSELAFFVFMTVILTAGVLILYAYGIIAAQGADLFLPGEIGMARYLARLLFASGVMVATALFFGAFLIYPLIRTQVQEEGKLRAMTETLSARSETLEHAALTDGLTGMQNRRYFDDALKEYHRRVPPHRQAGRPDGARPRPLQDGQRHPRPRCRRRCAEGRGGLPARHDALSRRRGPPRRRGVRGRRP